MIARIVSTSFSRSATSGKSHRNLRQVAEDFAMMIIIGQAHLVFGVPMGFEGFGETA
jgi:hypothetical protein